MDRTSGSVTSSASSVYRSGSALNNNNNSSSQNQTGSVTTLAEAAAVFESVAKRASRCSLQIAAFKANEQTYRRFLLERALPAADAALKERDDVLNRHEEDYGNAALRLRGVPVSPTLGSPATRRRNNGETARALDDPTLAGLVSGLKNYSAQYGKPSSY